jgi:CheY-like chemotaxis protein
MDDDASMRELLYLYLANEGYRVLLAEDAIAAGHHLLDDRIDLLLADIEMPFLDGLDLVRAMRKDPAVRDTPVIFITSHAEYEAAGKALGAVAYLRKPVRREALLAAVARHAFAAHA